MTNSWYKIRDSFLEIWVHVVPGAQQNQQEGLIYDTENRAYLKVRIHGIPEKGKVNQELIKYLAKELKIAKTAFSIVHGVTNRKKHLCISLSAATCKMTIIKQLAEWEYSEIRE